MAAALFEHGAIRTTEAKAKELRRFVEKLITMAKQGTLHARRRVISALGRDRNLFGEEGELLEQTVIQKLFDEIAPRYADRPGGYTRIIRLAERRIGDAGRQVILQLVEETTAETRSGAKGASRRRHRAAKRHEAVSAAAAAARAGEAEPEDVEVVEGPPETTQEKGVAPPQAAGEDPAKGDGAPADHEPRDGEKKD